MAAAARPSVSASSSSNWTVITESRFAHEREALEFIRQRFPGTEPYRAWTNFSFLALDGTVNEVDLLVYSPSGFFLVELKGHPGRLTGDAATWTFDHEGRRTTIDNPLFLADLKAKRLKNLLERQRSARRPAFIPRLDAAVFCSAPGLHVELPEQARGRLLLRDRTADPATGATERPGIVALFTNRTGPGFPPLRDCCDRPTGQAIAAALVEAGIKPLPSTRQVGDYVLGVGIDEGPGWQDYRGAHRAVENSVCRVRLYAVDTAASPEERNSLHRAAHREFQLLESLEHPGILRAKACTAHDLGPAVLFDHDPREIRLDHYLAQRGASLSLDRRLALIRQIAEAVQHAHAKRIVHRGLSPRSILVLDDGETAPRPRIFNWQIGCRDLPATTAHASSRLVTTNVESLTDRGVAVYQAPEVRFDPATTAEQVDVFSLGAIAYHVLSGQPPAANALELGEKLRASKGLALAAVIDGADANQDQLVRWATHPEVSERLATAAEFLRLLDVVEDALTRPAAVADTLPVEPTRARDGDVLDAGSAGRLTVVRRLGRGGSSVGFVVSRGDDDLILKLALSPDHADRIRHEADVLKGIEHERIVRFVEPVEIDGLAGFLMEPAYVNRDTRSVETLADRLRSEGRLQIEFLERFGTDLLEGLRYLEKVDVFHRDLKPDNIAIGKMGRDNALHLVLFDFSLSGTPADNLRAGTVAYLDPFLASRPHRRYDWQAERWAAAMTLHEMATRARPVWGTDGSDPAQLDCEVTLEPEGFDTAIRPGLAAFFTRALRRDPASRFASAEAMLEAWAQVFREADRRAAPAPRADDAIAGTDTADPPLPAALGRAAFTTAVADLGLSTRALGALDRCDVLTVDDLLRTPAGRLAALPGVGHKTRREISATIKALKARLGEPSATPLREAAAEAADPATLGIEPLLAALAAAWSRESAANRRMATALLGLDPALPDPWPTQSAVARHEGTSPPYVSQLVTKLQGRFAKIPAIEAVCNQIAGLLAASGSVMTADEVATALVAARGSAAEGDEAIRRGRAVVRAAWEVERTADEPRFGAARIGDRIHIYGSDCPEAADWAERLGRLADDLATADPLLPPASIADRLRAAAPPPAGIAIDDTRLIRLAAAASTKAAVSSKQELYPRGMPATRALRLAQAAIIGRPEITPDDIRTAIHGRYPEACPLPDQPALGILLTETGCEFDWVAEKGHFKNRIKTSYTVTSASRPPTRLPTDSASGLAAGSTLLRPAEQLSPAALEARQFEMQLARASRDGQFVAVLVPPRHHDLALACLPADYGLTVIDVEAELLAAMRSLAAEHRVPWDLVVASDDATKGRDWENLLRLARRAADAVKETLLAERRPILLVRAAILARYRILDVIESLQQSSGTRGGVPGVWLLIPGGEPRLDGVVVPLETTGQKAVVPRGWIQKHVPRP